MKTDADKVYLDLNDEKDLEEHFSRKEPGDVCKLEITATLDEIANKIAVLSITSVKALAYSDGTEDVKPEEAESEATAEPDESEEPALKMMNGKQ